MVDLKITDLATVDGWSPGDPIGLEIRHGTGTTANAAIRHSVCRVTGDQTTAVVTSAALLVYAGVVDVVLPKGLYVVFGVNAANVLDQTPAYVAQVTDGAEATAARSRSVIADRIRLLGLPVEVHEQWNAMDLSNVTTFPCIILSVDNVRESAEKSFNQTDDIGRPVKVSIIDTISKTDHSRLGDVETWRQRIEQAFRGQQLPMPESVMCRVEYDSVIDPTLPPMDVLSSEFVIRHITREFRGL